jgi:D-amino peptidase
VRVLISIDMEGVAGVVAPDDIRPGHAEYERNRGYMTDEASAAVRGVLTVDAEASIVVCDAHAGFRNLLPDRLDPRCRLLRGSPRRHAMMTGIDDQVDAVCLIGYHAMAGTADSVLAHTISGGSIASVRCNGRELGELGLNAALAAHYGAATVLATGDDTLVREAELTVPGITAVEVKRAFGNRATASLHPAESCARIEAATQRALRNRPDPGALVFDGAVDLEVDMHRPVMTELARLIPGVESRGPLTLGFSAANFAAAYDLIEVFTVLAANA